MKRFLCLALALTLAFSAAGAALATEETEADYTVAGKLLKQLWAGSGFSGTAQVEITANEGAPAGVLITQKPLNLEWDYIYVRQDGLIQEERRADVTLMENETAQSSGHLQWKDLALSFQLDALGSDWYRLTMPDSLSAGGGDAASTMGGKLGAAIGGQLEQTSLSGFLGAFLPLVLTSRDQTQDVSALLDSYLLRMDLWIEGYRQSAELGKLANGTATVETRYAVSSANVKAQLKQMLLDLLSDGDNLALLSAYMGREAAELLLNPALQSYYFVAIDALPLTGDLTITRTVSVRGDTLNLHMALPFYDVNGGNVTLRYDRAKGEGDLPDDITLSLESEQRALRLTYLEYSSMTDVSVIQGTFVNEPTESGFAVTDGQEPRKPVALAFTLRKQTAQGKDAEGRDTYECDYKLTLTPDPERDAAKIAAFEDVEIDVNALFASKTLKTAATEMTLTLTAGGEKRPRTLKATINGKTRRQWSPEDLPGEIKLLNTMSTQEFSSLLTTSAASTLLAWLPYFSVTQDGAEARSVTAADILGWLSLEN